MSREGQYFMELCDGEACRREPIERHEAIILQANISAGKHLYAKELPEGESSE